MTQRNASLTPIPVRESLGGVTIPHTRFPEVAWVYAAPVGDSYEVGLLQHPGRLSGGRAGISLFHGGLEKELLPYMWRESLSGLESRFRLGTVRESAEEAAVAAPPSIIYLSAAMPEEWFVKEKERAEVVNGFRLRFKERQYRFGVVPVAGRDAVRPECTQDNADGACAWIPSSQSIASVVPSEMGVWADRMLEEMRSVGNVPSYMRE